MLSDREREKENCFLFYILYKGGGKKRLYLIPRNAYTNTNTNHFFAVPYDA